MDAILSFPPFTSCRIVIDHRALMGHYFFNSLMIAFPLTATGIFLNNDLRLKEKPELLVQYYGALLWPSLCKICYGGLSDALPIYGLRRKPYIVLGNVLAAVLSVLFGCVVKDYTTLVVVGVSLNVFTAIAETGADGLLVERACGDPGTAASLQSAAMAVRTTGSIIGSLLSLLLINYCSPKTIISLAGVGGVFAALCGALVRESKLPKGPTEAPTPPGGAAHLQRSSPLDAYAPLPSQPPALDPPLAALSTASPLEHPAAAAEAGVGPAGGEEEEAAVPASLPSLPQPLGEARGVESPPASSQCLPLGKQGKRVVEFARTVGVQLAPVAVYLFVTNALPSALDTYESFVYSAWGKHLSHFDLTLRSFVDELGSLAGVLLFWRYFTKIKVQYTLIVTTVLGCLAGLTRLYFTQLYSEHHSIHMASHAPLTSAHGIPIPTLIIADSVLIALSSNLAFMPLITLAAAQAPAGAEASSFAAMTSFVLIGDEVGVISSSWLTASLQVGAPPLRSWHNLSAMLVLCSLLKLAVLPLVAFLPKLQGASDGSAEGGGEDPPEAARRGSGQGVSELEAGLLGGCPASDQSLEGEPLLDVPHSGSDVE